MTVFIRSLIVTIVFVTVPAVAENIKFDFRAVPVSQIVQLIYSQALDKPYIIDSAVLSDTRLISFRYDKSAGPLRKFIPIFFDSIGLAVVKTSGIDVIVQKPKVDIPEKMDFYVYKPLYRDASYLIDVASSLVKGAFASNKTIRAPVGDKSPQQATPPGSAASLIDRGADTIVFSGKHEEVARLKDLLPQIDAPLGEVMVRAVLYEVANGRKSGSAFSLALNILGGKLGISVGTASQGDSAVRFKNQTIDAIFSALSTDSRFKVVSKPSLRVRSGASGRFTVGQDVPILGALSFPGNGQTPVQSVEYRSSGVIFDLQPEVHERVIDLTLSQQVSNFVVTDTGVNASPTLTKREIKTSLSLEDGEVVFLGGLAENKDAEGKTGPSFLPDLLRTNNAESSDSEILLFLQVSKI